MIQWLEQTSADVPDGDDWLSARESLYLSRLHVPKRRSDWRLGRWTAKRAVALYLSLRPNNGVLHQVEILPDTSGAPLVRISDEQATVSISLTHRDGRAACVVAPPQMVLGCDLEVIEPRSNAFVGDYFTDEEQAAISQTQPAQRNLLVTILWSAKESALKALRLGLRVDTRSVSIGFVNTDVSKRVSSYRGGQSDECNSRFPEQAWYPLRAQCRKEPALFGWWRSSEGLVRSLISLSPTNPPSSYII